MYSEAMKTSEQTTVCAVTSCERPRRGRAWCSMHYKRWAAHGDPTYTASNYVQGGTNDDRFWAKVAPTAICWDWVGGKTGQGYGLFTYTDASTQSGKRTKAAHRYAWELLVGPIPDGLVLDHLCRNPSCVNPDHLEPVTRAENALRGHSPAVRQHKAGVCARGHVVTAERRYCLPCRRLREAAKKRRASEQGR